MGIYVDDCILIGDGRAIEEAINNVKKHFDITTEEVHDFIGCSIEKRDDLILLNQPDLIRKLSKTFKDDIKDMKDYETPAGSGFKITRPTKEEELLNKENQKKYRSRVGSLLYLVKHSRPELLNAVQELSK